IGVHTHVNYDDVRLESGAQDCWIGRDAAALATLGFPAPVTWIGGDFFTTSKTVMALEAAGLSVDCTVSPYEGALYHARTGELYADYLDCPGPYPFTPSRENICHPGLSRVVELPVCGYLPELHRPGDPNVHLPRAGGTLRERLRARR